MRAQRVGLLTIVRQGVAKRMQQDAEQSLKLDPAVDQGGALRLLSRLNATLPKVPFVSGWVDRKKVLPLANGRTFFRSTQPETKGTLGSVAFSRESKRSAPP